MTDTGEVEMDASIMDGTNMKAGGVTLVKNILTPVKLSRLVMEKVKFKYFYHYLYDVRNVIHLIFNKNKIRGHELVNNKSVTNVKLTNCFYLG